MGGDRREPAEQAKHVVVLVHGIRTRASWFPAVREALEAGGFIVAPTNFGRFSLIKFLFPIPFFKTWAALNLEEQIRHAMQVNEVDKVSVIAHSFGTFCIGWILRKKFDIAFRHIIFC